MHNNIQKIAQNAQLAMLYEVTCINKPGLVDPVDPGSHQDMDIFTFLQSSVVLTPYFEEFIQTGLDRQHQPIEETFIAIRQIGLEAETAMFSVTNGINTHKGAIFSLGIFLAICGRLTIWKVPCKKSFFKKEIKKMTKNLLDDFGKIDQTKPKAWTWGEYLFVNHGLTGIRGEAKRGYPCVFDRGLPYYQAHQGSQQEKMIDTLLFLSTEVEDTNLIKRSNNRHIFEEYQLLIHPYFELGGAKTAQGKEYLNYLNQQFKKKNWSIGGSADLLILTIFLDRLMGKGWLC